MPLNLISKTVYGANSSHLSLPGLCADRFPYTCGELKASGPRQAHNQRLSDAVHGADPHLCLRKPNFQVFWFWFWNNVNTTTHPPR